MRAIYVFVSKYGVKVDIGEGWWYDSVYYYVTVGIKEFDARRKEQ